MTPPALEVEVLSSAAGRSSGYLVRSAGGQVLVDCGPGTALALARSGRLEAIDAVVITHEHGDHASDVIGLAYARRFPDPMAPIPLLAPSSTLWVLERLDDLFAVSTLPEMAKTIAASFDPHPLAMDGSPVAMPGGLRLAAFAMAHAVPSAGLRFSAGATTVAFSSDTGECDALGEVAEHADLFICEATYLAATPELLKGHGHLTPDLAAGIAHQASARRLALGHLSRPGDALAAVEAARRAFDPDGVNVAADGSVITV